MLLGFCQNCTWDNNHPTSGSIGLDDIIFLGISSFVFDIVKFSRKILQLLFEETNLLGAKCCS